MRKTGQNAVCKGRREIATSVVALQWLFAGSDVIPMTNASDEQSIARSNDLLS